MNRFLLYSLVLFLLSCSQENMQVYSEEFEPFVLEFFRQAELRDKGMFIEDYDFAIEFGITKDEFTAGQCSQRRNEITIDKEVWDNYDIPQKEHLIFHELGHCLLELDHYNTKSNSGECQSFMRGGEDGFKCSLNLYSQIWRRYYLDELFSVETTPPHLSSDAVDYISALQNIEKTEMIETTHFYDCRIDSIPLDSYRKYLVEVEYLNWETEASLAQLNLGNVSFSNCNICTGTKTHIYSQSNRLTYLDTVDQTFNTNIKLSIVKLENFVLFYVNEKYTHIMESDLVRGNLLDLFSGNRNDNIQMNIRILVE